MSEWNLTTEGLVKAMALLAERPGKDLKKRQENPRFKTVPYGTAVHMRNGVSAEKRDKINALITKINEESDKDNRDALLKDLRAMPITFVPLKRQERIDRSRYTGEKLREIRAAGGHS